jgi:CheY-like chemotaxis protein
MMSSASPPRRLRVLCVEDSAVDADLVERALVEGGYDVDMDLAMNRAQFERLLAGGPYGGHPR